MLIKFNFEHEGGKPHGTMVPSNIMLAYHDAKVQKKDGILSNLIAFCLTLFFAINAANGIVKFLLGDVWFIIFTCLAAYFAYKFIESLMWKGPKAVLLFTVLSTVSFEEYIAASLEAMSKMISPESIMVTFIPQKKIKKIEKEMISAEILMQLYKECNNYDNIYDAVNFLADNYYNLSGFIVKELKQ